jgi:predicted O-methyltransferase YrrM
MTSHFDSVSATFGDLDYMRESEARLLRDIVIANDVRDILEIGFYQGKSSAYLAAVLEDLGRGHLVTIDREKARRHRPNIEEVLLQLGLTHRVTPVFTERSYTWEMARLIRQQPRPQFDLCYFDGGHTWDQTGFGFVLVDMVLRPGGLIVFDDLTWTIESAMRERSKIPAHWQRASEDERRTPGVQLVFDLLVPHLGYTDIRVANEGRWGIARKPHDAAASQRVRGGTLARLRGGRRR